MDKMFTKAAKLLPPNIQKIYGGDGGQWVGLKAKFPFFFFECTGAWLGGCFDWVDGVGGCFDWVDGVGGFFVGGFGGGGALCLQVRVHSYMHVCRFVCIHTCTHTHTCVCVCVLSKL
jgi:hypothetical protein